MQFVLLAVGAVGSMYAAYRIARAGDRPSRGVWSSFAPYAALVAILTALNVWLFLLPMPSRM